MAKVGLKPSVVDLSDRNARSDYVLTVNLSLHPPPPANRAPVALVPGVSVEMDRNTERTLDLREIFSDPDGDRLSYFSSGGERVQVSFREGDVAALVPERNWYGRENITITATDPYNARASAWVDVTVRRAALPPEIVSRVPEAENVTAARGSELNFVVEALDPDQLPLTYRWYEGGRQLPNTTASILWRVPAEGGVVRVSVNVSNGQSQVEAGWNVTCALEPPLQVSIITPHNNTRVRRGENVSFYAMIPGLPASQQAEYSFTWYLGGRVLSELPSFSTKDLPAGSLRVKVRAVKRDDPSRSAEASVVLRVGEEERGQDWTVPAALTVAGAAVALGGGALVLHRRAERRRALREMEERARDRKRRRPGRGGERWL